MQTSGPCYFEPRRMTTSRRPALSSEIVRPVFQRKAGGQRYNGSPVHGTERDCAPERLLSMKPGLPAVAASFQPTTRILESVNPMHLPPAPKNTTEAQLFAEVKPSEASSAKALVMVANSARDQAQEEEEEAQPQPKRKRIRPKTERRREQCRANQARYRQKQLNHAKEVTLDVQRLRADIPVLELQRNRLLYGGQQNVWNVVVEYFHVFRFGVPVSLPVESMDTATGASPESKHQLAFLRSSMTEDVILGERSGVDAVVPVLDEFPELVLPAGAH